MTMTARWPAVDLRLAPPASASAEALRQFPTVDEVCHCCHLFHKTPAGSTHQDTDTIALLSLLLLSGCLKGVGEGRRRHRICPGRWSTPRPPHTTCLALRIQQVLLGWTRVWCRQVLWRRKTKASCQDEAIFFGLHGQSQRAIAQQPKTHRERAAAANARLAADQGGVMK